MTKIKKSVKMIDEELKGAKEYAEKYVECKAAGNTSWATRYKEMAQDELKHANYIHEKAVADIEEISKIYKAPVEMQKKWDESHALFVEKTAWIKQMLAM